MVDSFGPEYDTGPALWQWLAAAFVTAVVLGVAAYGFVCVANDLAAGFGWGTR